MSDANARVNDVDKHVVSKPTLSQLKEPARERNEKWQELQHRHEQQRQQLEFLERTNKRHKSPLASERPQELRTMHSERGQRPRGSRPRSKTLHTLLHTGTNPITKQVKASRMRHGVHVSVKRSKNTARGASNIKKNHRFVNTTFHEAKLFHIKGGTSSCYQCLPSRIVCSNRNDCACVWLTSNRPDLEIHLMIYIPFIQVHNSHHSQVKLVVYLT